MPIPQFPTLVTRATNGAPLSNAQADTNLTAIRAYCLTLANLLASSINPDGTLAAASVGSQALQSAAVTLASLNPALLYSIIPVDTDAGTGGNYAITAQGGASGANIVPNGATYDVNGNYVLAGLTLNYGYYWTKNANDTSVVVNSATTLAATGAFAAVTTSVTLTGVAGEAVTATVAQSAPISAYKSGQIFFVWTARANTGAATLNVNNLGAVPILSGGQPLQFGAIQGSSVFVVVYMNGAFNLWGGGTYSSASGTTATTNFTINGTTLFSSGGMALPNAAVSIAHGFGVAPTSVAVVLQKVGADATPVNVNQVVPIGEFLVGGNAAFVVSYDSNVITVTPTAGTISLGGTNITNASWNLVINATKQTNVVNTVLPALDYMCNANPAGAISYNGMLLAWENNANAGVTNGRAINMTNNETTFLTIPPSGNLSPDYGNPALFTRANGSIDIIFTSSTGVYRIPAVNPTVNIVPAGSFYSALQVFSMTITADTAYTITKGANDLSYSFDGVTFTNLGFAPTNIPSSNTNTTLYLKGSANALVTASVSVTAPWQYVQIATNGSYQDYKPVWITESSGTISNIYVVTSGYAANNWISGTEMFNLSGGGATEVGGVSYRPDFTNNNIVNIAPFQTICPNGSSARVTFFAYNPFNKRMYIMTSNSALLHIFQLIGNYGTGGVTNDITAWWSVINTTVSKYTNLAYVKSMSIPGTGNYWNSGDPGRQHMSIEINQQTGAEVALIFTRGGSQFGGITRVTWVE